MVKEKKGRKRAEMREGEIKRKKDYMFIKEKQKERWTTFVVSLLVLNIFFLKAASLQMTCFYLPPNFCHTDSHTPLVHSYTHVHAHTHIYHTYSYTLSVTHTPPHAHFFLSVL